MSIQEINVGDESAKRARDAMTKFDEWWRHTHPGGAVLAIEILEVRKSRLCENLTEVVCRPAIYESTDSKRPIAVGAKQSFAGKGGFVRFVLPPLMPVKA